MNDKDKVIELIPKYKPRVTKDGKIVMPDDIKLTLIIVALIMAIPMIMGVITFIGIVTTRPNPIEFTMFDDINNIVVALDNMDIPFSLDETNNEILSGLEVESYLTLSLEFEGRVIVLYAYIFSNQEDSLIYIERASGLSPIEWGPFYWIYTGTFFWRQYSFLSRGQKVMHIGGSNLWVVNRFLRNFFQELRLVVDSHD